MRSFDGRLAYVFGGSMGIGLASAKRFASLEADVVVLARGAVVLERAAAEFTAAPVGAEGAQHRASR